MKAYKGTVAATSHNISAFIVAESFEEAHKLLIADDPIWKKAILEELLESKIVLVVAERIS